MRTLTLEALTHNVQGGRVTFTEDTTLVIATGTYSPNSSPQGAGRENLARAQRQLQQFWRLTSHLVYITNNGDADTNLLATITPNGAGFSLCVLVGNAFCTGNGGASLPNFEPIPLRPEYIISAGLRYVANAEAQDHETMAWKVAFA